MKKIILLSTFFTLLIFGNYNVYAQSVGVSGTGSVPDASALLDIDATGMNPMKGLLIPRMTTAQRTAISSPAQSLQIYNTDDKCLQIYIGTSWQNIFCSNCTSPPATAGSVTGSTNPCQNATGVSYIISPVAGSTSYTWTVPSGATITAGQNTTGIVVTFGTTDGNVAVTASNSCGTSVSPNLAITLQTTTPAQPSTITGTTPVCQNQTSVAYSVTNVAGVTYTWTYSGSGFTVASGQGTNAITANFSGSATTGTLTVTPSSGCGNGTAQTFAVTVNTLLASPTAGTQTPSASQIIWNWNTVSGATGYRWNTINNYATATDNATSTTHTQTGLSPLTSYTLYVWAYNSSCGNSSVTNLTSTTSVTYIEDVFSAYAYTGNGATQTITNGIDLAGQGGMVWIKNRTSALQAFIHETMTTGGPEPGYYLCPSLSAAESYGASYLTAFTSTGFSIGSASYVNANAADIASWTFRNAPKFFTQQVLSHTSGTANNIDLSSLGTVGMVAIKRTDGASDWMVFHRSATTGKLLYLNTTAAETTDATLTLAGTTLTVASALTSGIYDIFAWAHDIGAEGLVQCGSFTTGASNTDVNLGWEPQYVIWKNLNTEDWGIFDNSRGVASGTSTAWPNTQYGYSNKLTSNTAAAEITSTDYVDFKSDGFNYKITAGGSGRTYVYMAIRKPMKTPTSGAQVFNGALFPSFTAQAVDFGLQADLVMCFGRSGNTIPHINTRLTGFSCVTYDVYSESSFGSDRYDYGKSQNSVYISGGAGSGTNLAFLGFKRYDKVFDVLSYTGGGTSVKLHNLRTTPELWIVRSRELGSSWYVGSTLLGSSTNYLKLESTAAVASAVTGWNANPTSTSMDFATGFNTTDKTYFTLLFATLAGVSKVGTYTGNGTTQTIACGFASGARFILIKRTDSTGDWIVWDAVRGIVSGNDPHINLNNYVAEVTSDDSIDPDASGFIVNQVGGIDINVNAATYIFLAIN